MLSESYIQSIKITEKRYKIYDGDGLILLICPHGGRWWRFKYYFLGKEKQLSLGTYPGVSLDEARKEKDRLKEILKNGLNPSTQRKIEKSLIRKEMELTDSKEKNKIQKKIVRSKVYDQIGWCVDGGKHLFLDIKSIFINPDKYGDFLNGIICQHCLVRIEEVDAHRSSDWPVLD